MARLITGKVSSDKADKTIVITVTTRRTHPLYKKQYSLNSKYMAHDEKNEAKMGDMVIIRETRPISAKKRFALDKILEKSGDVYLESDAEAGVELPEKEVQPIKPAKAEKPAEETKEEVKAEPKEEVKEAKPKKVAKEKKA